MAGNLIQQPPPGELLNLSFIARIQPTIYQTCIEWKYSFLAVAAAQPFHAICCMTARTLLLQYTNIIMWPAPGPASLWAKTVLSQSRTFRPIFCNCTAFSLFPKIKEHPRLTELHKTLCKQNLDRLISLEVRCEAM